MFNKEKISSFVSLFKKETLPLHDGQYSSNTQSIFIGGCGRSGTTLLRIMLGEHPEIFSGPELNVHTNIIYALENRFVFLPKKTYLLYDKSILQDIADKFEFSPEKIINIRDRSTCLAHFIDQLLCQVALKNNKKIWLEKTPKNVTILSFIFRYFPRSKFIHIIRDGRDVVCSLRNHPAYVWKDGKKISSNINRSIEECSIRWVSDVCSGLRFRGSDQYFEIKYEDLVHNPDEILRKVCKFLGVNFEQSMLAYHTNFDKKNETKHFLPSANAVEKLNDSKIDRWKKDLSFDEAKVFESIAGNLLKKLGYVSDSKEWLLWYEK